MWVACVTALRSPDPSTVVGAVIVDEDNTIVSAGYNAFPRGYWQDGSALWANKELKYKFVVHAEANAIYNAGRQGKSLKGTKIYLNWFPCCECFKAIIQSGVKEVVYLEFRNVPDSWKQSFEDTRQMATEAGIILTKYKGALPDFPMLKNGVDILLKNEVVY